MHVIATAGHVDHGKSALVRALTGMEPDRWEEEARRGMTIDLGYAWTLLPSGEEVAFVDVPGHERFATNMLAGVGPAPAALLVVAADGGWAPQTAEHVAALDALGVTHAVLAVTRADLADPAPVLADVGRRLGATSLAGAEAVAVSARTGQGLDGLRAALDRLVAGLPTPRRGGRVRLWVDRAFPVRGFGTVVTGTLGAGALAAGDTFELGEGTVRVRGLETLGRPAEQVAAVARVAVNLRAAPPGGARRGQALLTPGAWLQSDTVDARFTGPPPERLPRQVMVHVGSAAVAAGTRRLADDLLRLQLAHPLPLQVGDRLLLRDPGLRRLLGGVTVLDPAPPALQGRGAGRARADSLAEVPGSPDAAAEVRRRGVVAADFLRRIGVDGDAGPGARHVGAWLVDEDRWASWGSRLADLVDADRPDALVEDGVARDVAARELGLPDPELVDALTAELPGLRVEAGRVRRHAGRRPPMRPELARQIAPLLERLAAAPFDAPAAAELEGAGLGPRQLAAAEAAGALVRLAGNVVVAADAPARAAAVVAGLGRPFTLSDARQALGTTRRVAVPLLEHLDRLGLTRRLDTTLRVAVPRPAEAPPG